MNKRKVIFRADASLSIGYGHFIRSLALADMLKEDFDCTFVTTNPTKYQLSEMERVCNHISLHEESKDSDFLDILQGNEIVVLDNYFHTSAYEHSIKSKGCKLVCIDDIHSRHFYADAIINYCINNNPYNSEPYTRIFTGMQWALLRKPFLCTEKETHDTLHWVITFGGSDQYNISAKYVNILRNALPQCKITLVLGNAYKHSTKEFQDSGIEICRNLSAEQMAALFRKAANVICSASTVCYEALACHCRVFAGFYVDNQIDLYNNLLEQKLISPLGKLTESTLMPDTSYSKKEFSFDFSKISFHYKLLFKAISLTVVEYSQMKEEQSLATWECRNNNDIRKWMTNPEPFSYESHKNFVNRLRNDNTRAFYSFFDKDTFIGAYNFVDIIDNDSAERGLFVNPAFQGQHIATMMELLLDGEIKKRGVCKLLAKVLKTNKASLSYHKKIGYVVVGEAQEYINFERTI